MTTNSRNALPTPLITAATILSVFFATACFAAGAGSVDDHFTPTEEALVEAIAEANKQEAPLTLEDKALRVLQTYCASCHGGTAAYPTQFLAGEKEDVINNLRYFKFALQLKVQHRIMPPIEPARTQLWQSGDVNILLEYIDSL